MVNRASLSGAPCFPKGPSDKRRQAASLTRKSTAAVSCAVNARLSPHTRAHLTMARNYLILTKYYYDKPYVKFLIQLKQIL